MATAAVLSAMTADAQKSIHPLFLRANGHYDKDKPNVPETSTTNQPAIQIDDHAESNDKAKRTNSKRKQKGEREQSRGKIQRTLSGGISSARILAPVSEPTIEAEPRPARSKRRKTGEYAAAEVGAAHEAGEVDTSSLTERQTAPQVIVSRSSPSENQTLPYETTAPVLEYAVTPRTPSPAPQAAPKKMMRLKANGTFSSPPGKSSSEAARPETPKRRGRPRKAAASSAEKSLLVKMSYGSDASSKRELGDKISRILEGLEVVPLIVKETSHRRRMAASKEATPKKPSPKKRTPEKTGKMHPLFQRGKSKEDAGLPKQESPRKVTASTPGKLRMQAMSDRNHDIERDSQPFASALLKDRLMTKHPGAQDPPFPFKGLSHSRGLDDDQVHATSKDISWHVSLNRLKRKHAALPLPRTESILYTYAAKLKPEQDRSLRPDGFVEPDDRLKLPERLLISGQDVAYRISEQISVPLHDPAVDFDELTLSSSQVDAHPALQRLYNRIPTTMTAFDESRGEIMSWTQKYAPSASPDVLQPVAMMDTLLQWLKSLSVQAVGGAAPASSTKTALTRNSEKPKKKRKKKTDEMDDFLVDSDEDMHEMSELADSAPVSPTASTNALKSVVQAVNGNHKLSNAVLLSGPHGCGKTAAAYAVAKELDFKIFEISSNERRSGKDVLDRIGDMTENHLMKHHGIEAVEGSVLEEPSHMEEAFQKELETGRQGKMSSFFKPKGGVPVKAKPKPVAEPKKILKEKTLKAVQEALKKPSKDQQQSLILLEEVDVLFKDDKEFWSTILKLIVSSKRPFIMTCNDEDLVPFQAMTLHAILRFQPSSVKLATDYILLLAAAEGHLLKRAAVASLYEHHERDLRATITELDYWCQMGVGDPREGLSWIYQRWPPGSDVDHFGRKVRVISENTYQQGMGIVPDVEPNAEDALWWAWNNFNVEPHIALGWKACNGSDPAAAGLDAPTSPRRRLKDLLKATAIADALSAADTCSTAGLSDTAPLDTTQPELKDNARGNYIEGMQLLQTDERVDYANLSQDLLIALTVTAYRALDSPNPQSARILARIPAKKAETATEKVTRRDFACFDAISAPAEPTLANPGLQQSAFDGPISTIAVDLAPYVRSIVQYDQALEEQRERLNLLDSDGRRAKRARTTRAARSAVEGSQRANTRKERWFTKSLSMSAVLATGGREWPKYAISIPSADGDGTSVGGWTDEAPASSAEAA